MKCFIHFFNRGVQISHIHKLWHQVRLDVNTEHRHNLDEQNDENPFDIGVHGVEDHILNFCTWLILPEFSGPPGGSPWFRVTQEMIRKSLKSRKITGNHGKSWDITEITENYGESRRATWQDLFLDLPFTKTRSSMPIKVHDAIQRIRLVAWISCHFGIPSITRVDINLKLLFAIVFHSS